MNKTPKNGENSIVFQVFFHSRLLEIVIACNFAEIALAVNIFCELACLFGQFSNGPRFFIYIFKNFFSWFSTKYKEFELVKQFEGYICDIYATLCSITALRRYEDSLLGGESRNWDT